MHTPWAHQMLMSSLSHVSQEWSRSNESCYSHTSQCTPLYPLISYSLWSANNNYNAVFNKNLILGLLTLAVLAYMPMCLHFYYKCCQTFLLCIALIVFNNTFFFFFTCIWQTLLPENWSLGLYFSGIKYRRDQLWNKLK